MHTVWSDILNEDKFYRLFMYLMDWWACGDELTAATVMAQS